MRPSEEPFFDPFHELSGRQLRAYRSHYGPEAGDADIRELVYNGLPLSTLFGSIRFTATEDQVRSLRATIRLGPAPGSGLAPLLLEDVSLRQFLVAGLPRNGGPGEGGWHPDEDRWGDLDEQYRLELCHSEISRWSLVFKRDGVILGGARLEGHEPFSHIELVNNCTNVKGFEWKLRRDRRWYHGSFGRAKRLLPLYRRLSQRQAGSLAWQGCRSLDGTGGPSFFDLYKAFTKNRWNSGRGAISQSPRIDLGRYRSLNGGEEPLELRIDDGPIPYDRWGESSELYQKPFVRRLVRRWRSADGTEHRTPPESYADLRDAELVELPNFTPAGLYAHHDPVAKRYRWLYELDRAVLRRQADGRSEIELRRAGDPGAWELRRLVLGNLDLPSLPHYPDGFTFHRLGYGARPTTMAYDPSWRPPTDPSEPAHFAYLLGGKSTEEDRYIMPEAYGVERVILSRIGPQQMLVDLIGFERILPVWRAVLTEAGS